MKTHRNIDIALHNTIIGKPDFILNNATNKRECFMHGVKTSLGHNWATIEMAWDELFEAITVHGMATSSALSNSNRTDDNFISRELVMVDIDYGMDLFALCNDDFYNLYGAGFYVSPSYTDEAHRFRIMFRLETPITDAASMKRLHEALMVIYPYADTACKDATRIFFGTENCTLKERRPNLLPATIVDELLLMVPVVAKAANTAPVRETSHEEVHTELNELRKHYSVLPYEDRRNVTWAVLAYLSAEDTIIAMRNRWPDNDSSNKYESIAKAFKAGSFTMGTIIHMIRLKDSAYKHANKAHAALLTDVKEGKLNVISALLQNYKTKRKTL